MNLWAGIVGYFFIEPFLLPGQLDGLSSYRPFHENLFYQKEKHGTCMMVLLNILAFMLGNFKIKNRNRIGNEMEMVHPVQTPLVETFRILEDLEY